MTVTCRKATREDVETLYDIIQGYAAQGIMLPRSRSMLNEQIDDFVVAEVDERLVGCGSLTRLGEDLVEIRSLGVTEGYKGLGIGKSIVAHLVDEAKNRNIPKVMALTYEVKFFFQKKRVSCGAEGDFSGEGLEGLRELSEAALLR